MSPFKLLCCCVLLMLTGGQATASTYNMAGTFNNGAALTGSIAVDNGTLISINVQTLALTILGPGFYTCGACQTFNGAFTDKSNLPPGNYEYSYSFGGKLALENYDPSTQVYEILINRDGSAASLDLVFSTLSGLILDGSIFDHAGPCGTEIACYVGGLSGTLTTPLPPALPLFASGICALVLLAGSRSGRRRDRTRECP